MEKFTNTQLADMLSCYNLYGTVRKVPGQDPDNQISGTDMLKLVQQRLRATEPVAPVTKNPVQADHGTTLSLFGERIPVEDYLVLDFNVGRQLEKYKGENWYAFMGSFVYDTVVHYQAGGNKAAKRTPTEYMDEVVIGLLKNRLFPDFSKHVYQMHWGDLVKGDIPGKWTEYLRGEDWLISIA